MPYRSAILSAIEGLKAHETGSPASSIRHHIKEHDTVFAAAIANSKDDTSWNETLFQTTLKQLVSKGILVHINGTNYKFTDNYLKKRAETLRERADSIEEHQHAIATATHNIHPREDPPKDCPKKKTVHAKVKLTEGKIITVVNPEKKRDEDEMETDDEDTDKVHEVLMSGDEHKKHVKIIPRKIGTKKM